MEDEKTLQQNMEILEYGNQIESKDYIEKAELESQINQISIK
jgi:hypothetical protein